MNYAKECLTEQSKYYESKKSSQFYDEARVGLIFFVIDNRILSFALLWWKFF